MKLVSPSAVYSKDFVGPYKYKTKIVTVPTMRSAEAGGEMVELYHMVLCRDVPFSEYSVNPQVTDAVKDLNKLSVFRGPRNAGNKVTWETLFRGNTAGDLIGPYVSQFLYQEFANGADFVDQEMMFYQEGSDLMKTVDKVLKVQNGNVTENAPPRNVDRYISTLRDGATYVHFDDPQTSSSNALKILYTLKCPLAEGLQIKSENAFVDLGPGDIHDLLTRAARVALLAAWYHKWSFLRLRPEVYGLRVNESKNSANKWELHPDLMDSQVLQKVFAANGNYLLTQCYPEGSPAHPSYPAGHATFSGAVTTILKAFFQEDFEINALVPDNANHTLVPAGLKVTVRNELDKLASNIGSAFRNGAGVHYRSDGNSGLQLGEQIALQLLKEHAKRYPYQIEFNFHLRNGKRVRIHNKKRRKN